MKTNAVLLLTNNEVSYCAAKKDKSIIPGVNLQEINLQQFQESINCSSSQKC